MTSYHSIFRTVLREITAQYGIDHEPVKLQELICLVGHQQNYFGIAGKLRKALYTKLLFDLLEHRDDVLI